MFLANKDILSYFNLKPQKQHNLVSVAGGLGFLHFITPGTQNLYLIDKSNNRLQYAELIIELIKISKDIFDFLSYVSCQKISRQPVLNSSCFIGRINRIESVKQQCNNKITRLYSDWIENGDLSNTYFFDLRKPGKTTWWFGQQWGFSSLRGEQSFFDLQKQLERISVHYIHKSLEEVDYSTIQNPAYKTYIFISNVESQNDRIYQQIINSALPQSAIILTSWHRQIVISLNQDHADAVRKLRPWLQNEKVIAIESYTGFYFNETETKAKAIIAKNITETLDLDDISDFSVLLYNVSLVDFQKDIEIAKRFLRNISTKFKRIVIRDRANTLETWLRIFKLLNLHFSYTIGYLDYNGGKTGFDTNFIMVLELRGLLSWQYQRLL